MQAVWWLRREACVLRLAPAQQGPRAGCVCDGQQRVWHRINGASRFAAQSVTPSASPRPKDAAAMPLHDQTPSARVAP